MVPILKQTQYYTNIWLSEKINVREGVIRGHISKITMDKEKEIPWPPTTTMFRGL